MPRTSWGDLRGLPVFLPDSVAEQSRIAAVLDTVDEAISQTETVIAKLKQIRTGVLQDLLTRGLDKNGKLRDPVVHPEQFRNSTLGRIPIGWEALTLEESCEWFSGGTPERSRASWWAGAIPLLTPKDMKSLELSDTSEHITEEALQSASRLMPEDTVFIVVRGMILAHTFPVCLSSVPFAFNKDIKAIRGRGKLNNRFLALWFAANADLFLRRATEATHGTKKLDTAELYRARIGVPSPEEQEAIITHIETVAQEEAAEIATHDKLLRLKSGLMSDLLTGRVQVPPDLDLN